MGCDENCVLLRRGYGQYGVNIICTRKRSVSLSLPLSNTHAHKHIGQPLDITLAAMTPLDAAISRPAHSFRRNMCLCLDCRERQPHGLLHSKCLTARRAEAQAVLTAQEYSQLQSLPEGHPLAMASRMFPHPALRMETRDGPRSGGSSGADVCVGSGGGGGLCKQGMSAGGSRATSRVCGQKASASLKQMSDVLNLMRGGNRRRRLPEEAGKQDAVPDEHEG